MNKLPRGILKAADLWVRVDMYFFMLTVLLFVGYTVYRGWRQMH